MSSRVTAPGGPAFRLSLRGYNRAEVDEFLRQTAADRQRLQEDLAQLEAFMATSGDERRFGDLRAHRKRQGRHRHTMWVMRVNDVRFQLLDDARQPPGGGQVHLSLRRKRDEVEPFGGPLPQFAFRMRHEHRPVAKRAWMAAKLAASQAISIGDSGGPTA